MEEEVKKDVGATSKEPKEPQGARMGKSGMVYVGTKIVRAEPMTNKDFQLRRGTNNESPSESDGYQVIYEDGYVSWSPKSVFERCYRLITPKEYNLL